MQVSRSIATGTQGAPPPRRRHLGSMGDLLASTAIVAVWRVAPQALLAGSLLVAAPAAWANPQGGQVVAGGASIVQSSPSQLTINQSSQSTIINWQSFNIGVGEQVNFAQPGASAMALNRVTGNQASQLLGQLSANGQVFLVNPNGVFVGRSAEINVGGLVVSTTDITNANFTAGKYVFNRPGNSSATIVNEGQVTVRDAGLAAFVGPTVANSGVIQARLGTVVLAAGTKFTLDLYGDNLVKLALDDRTGAALAKATVSNSGTIEADGGTVLITASAAKGVVDGFLNVGGTVEARTMSMQDGKIVLNGGGGTVTVGGTLDASGTGAGQTGGTVEVLGGAVNLASGASVNVSGDAGGGTALIGGNFHGAGPQPNAATTTVAEGAVIDADAVSSGNGGDVAVWADQATVFDGSITARGGAAGGNGGFVETSGKQNLSLGTLASVDTRAPKGTTGTWLLDPSSILIDDTDPGGDDDIATDTTDYPNFLTTGTVASGDGSSGGTAAAYLSPTALVTQLTTTNVSLSATTSITFGTNTGIAAGITSASGNSLTLNAGTTIDFAAAANLISISGGIKATASNVILGTSLSGGAGGVDLSGSTTDTLAASVTLTATNGAIKLGGNVVGAGADTLTLTPGAAGTVTLQAVGDTTAVAALSVTNGTTTLDGDVTTTGTQTYSGAVTIGGNDTLTTTNSLVDFASTVDDTVAGTHSLAVATGTGGVTFGAAVGTTALLSLDTTGTSGTITLDASVTTATTQTYAGPVTIGGNDTLTTTNSLVDFASTVDDATANTDSLAVAAGSGGVTFAAAVGAGTRLASLDTTGTSGTITLDASVTTSGGGQTYAGPVLLGGSVALTDQGGGTIAFSSTLTGGGNAITIIDNTPPTFASTVSGLSAATLAPFTAANTVAVGDSSLEPLTAADTQYDFVSTGPLFPLEGAVAGAVTIGSNTTTGGITMTQFSPSLNLALENGGTGAISVTGVYDGTGSLVLTSGSGGITLDTSVTTTGTQTYSSAVTIGGNDTLTTTNSLVDFASTVDDATANTDSLAVAAGSGGVTFAAAVGAGTRLASLDTTGTSGTITLDASVTTGGTQTYAGPTVIGGNDTLTTTNALVDFESTVDDAVAGTHSLVVATGTGGVTFGAAVGTTELLSLDTTGTSGTITLDASVTTASTQTYAGPVVIGGNDTLTTTNSLVDFASTVDDAAAGTHSLVVATGTGGVTFTGAVGTTKLLSLDTTGTSGTITLDASVTTASTQTYAGPVVIGGDDTLTTTNSLVDFKSTVDDAAAGTHSLVVATGTGGVTFGAAVGTTKLLSLDTTGTSGTITLDASVTTASTQTYAGPVVIGGDDTLTTTNSLVDFKSTVDDAAAGTHSLVVATGTGGVTFAAAVGTTKLLSLDTTGTSGTITLDASVTTASTQTYAGPVVIGGDDTLTTTNALVDFASTVDDAVAGTHSLVVATGTGGVTFGAAVGTTKLLSLDTTGTSGTITLDASVTTASTQTYAGPVVIGGDDTLTTTNALIDFASTVDDAAAGTHSLVVAAGTGGVTFAAAVGTTELLSLDTTGTSGTITLDVSVTTGGGGQTYAGPVVLGGSVTLTDTASGAIAFNSTLTGGGHAITILDDAPPTFDITDPAPTVSGLSAATLAPFTAANTVAVGDSSLEALSAADTQYDFISTGALFPLEGAVAGAVTIGSNATTGGITMTQFSPTLNLALVNGGTGAIGVTGVYDGTGSLALTSGSGGITLDTSVTTTGTQTYSSAVTIGGNDTLTTTNALVDFASTVDDAVAGTHSLVVATGTGGVTFGAAVGTTELLSLDTTGTSGTITLDASVTTASTQTYAGPVVIGGNDTLTTTNALVDFESTVDDAVAGTHSLVVATGTGGVTFGAAVGTTKLLSLDTTGTSGTITLDASVTTASTQTYAGPVVIGGNDTLTTTNSLVDFKSTVDDAVAGTHSLVVVAGTGGVTFGAAVGTTKLLSLDTTGTSGTITLDASVTTASTQTYAGPVVIGGDDTLTTTNALIDFASTVDDAVAGTHSLVVATGTGGVTFAAAVGTTKLLSLDTTGTSGTITLDASVTTASTQTYAGPVVIGGNDTLTTTNALVDFESTVDDAVAGTHSLVVATGTGGVTFTGAVGTTKLLSLDTTGTSGTITLDASVTTASTQTYAGPVVIGGDDTLTTTNALVDFKSTVDDAVAGTHSLVVATGTGGVTFAAAVGTTKLLSLDTTGTSGTITLDASVTTASTQTYAGPVVIGGNDTLTTTNSLVDFKSTVDDAAAGTHSLVVATGTGGVTFGAAVGTTKLLSLDTTGTSGTITLDASVTTASTQTYAGPVVIGGDDTLTTTNSLVDFASTVDDAAAGTHSLVVATGTGGVTFGAAVGTTKLLSLDTTGTSGTITLDASVTTASTQTYAGPVVIGGDDTLTTTNSLVDFKSTVDDAVAGTHSLVVATGTGGVTFAAAVGTTKLLSLDTTGTSGTITLDASVTTASTQTYAGPVVIGGNDTLTTTNSLVDFKSTVDDAAAGTHSLVVATGTGGVTFAAAVGTTKLLSLDTTGTSGTITLDASVTTASTQTYAGPVVIGGDDTLTTTNSLVDFKSTVDDAAAGTHSLVVATGTGGVTFGAAVGTTKLLSLDTTGTSGTITLDASVTTASTQTYAGPVVIGGDDTLTTTNALIDFASTVDDAVAGTHSLVVATGTGGVTFAAAVGTTKLLSLDTTGTSGTITLDASVTTASTQTYAGPVVIGGNDTLTTTNALVDFASTVDDAVAGTHSLVVATGTGGVTFTGAVGTTKLLSLDTTGTSGTITLDASVTTASTQTYAGPVVIGGNDTLTTTNALVDFESTVDDAVAGTHSLVVVAGTGGAITFGNAVGGVAPLGSLSATGVTIALQAITATGDVGLVATGGSLTLTQNVVGANLLLDAPTGAVTETGGAVLANTGTGDLIVKAAAASTLDTATNSVGVLAADVTAGGFSFVNAGSYQVAAASVTPPGIGATALSNATATGDIGLEAVTGTLTLVQNVVGANVLLDAPAGAVTETTGNVVANAGAGDLVVKASGASALDTTTNSVAVLAANVTAGGISFKNAGSYQVAAASVTPPGIGATALSNATATGDIGLEAVTGTLTLVQNVVGANVLLDAPAGAVTETTGNVVANAGAGDLVVKASGASALDTTTNSVAVLAANVTAGGFSFKNAGSYELAAASVTPPGIGATPLSNVTATGDIGLVAVTGTLSLAQNAVGANVLLEAPAGAVTEAAGSVLANAGAGDLIVEAENASALDSATNSVGILAADVTAGGFSFENAGSYEVADATVTPPGIGATSLSNVTATAGDVGLVAQTGTLTLAQNVVGSNVLLEAPNGAVTETAGDVLANGGAGDLIVEAKTASALDTATNSVGIVAADVTAGSFSYENAGSYQVGAATVTPPGIGATSLSTVTAIGDVALQAQAGTLTLAQNVVGQDVTLSAGVLTETTGSVTATGISAFTATTGTITFANAANAVTGTVTLTTSGANNATFDNNAATSVVSAVGGLLTVNVTGSPGTLGLSSASVPGTGALIPTGSLSATATGSILTNGALAVTGASTFTSTGGAVELTNPGDALVGAITISAATDVVLDNSKPTVVTVTAGSTLTFNQIIGSANIVSAQNVIFNGGNVSATAGENAIGKNSEGQTNATEFGGSSTLNGAPVQAGEVEVSFSVEAAIGVAAAEEIDFEIQQLVDKGDTAETAAQSAFDEYDYRPNYAEDPYRQRYDILGVAQEDVGTFQDISYIQDGFWEGLVKEGGK